jgi:hypothetical protein
MVIEAVIMRDPIKNNHHQQTKVGYEKAGELEAI